MAKRNHLDSYHISWYGPGGHESHRKVWGLNILSFYISQRLRKAKIVTAPETHEVHIQFRDDGPRFGTYQRHPKTVWLDWVRDYRDLEELSLDADNATIGEFSIKIAEELKERLKSNEIEGYNFPYEIVDDAIEEFRRNDYGFTSRLSPYKPFDASPLEARFFAEGDCTSTRVTIIFYLKRKEIHRRQVRTLGPGAVSAAGYTCSFDLYDSEIRFGSIDILNPSPVIRYDELPDEVSRHLPTNQQLHDEWGIPLPPQSK